MKYLFLIVMVLEQFLSFGQSANRQLDEWDTLRLRTNAAIRRYDEALQKHLCFTDTLKDKDVVLISYFSAEWKKLRTVTNHINATGCLASIVTGHYNNDGLLEYQQTLKKCCDQKLADDEKCFEYVIEYERFQYDELGRVIAHVFHISTPMTIKDTYTYSEDGRKQLKREYIREPQFWN